MSEIINFKDYDVNKLPSMDYPEDLLNLYPFYDFCAKCVNEKVACVYMLEDEKHMDNSSLTD